MYRIEETTIDEINKVIKSFFTNNESLTIVPVKVLMPNFIQSGIFAKDRKNGAPIRSILKQLDYKNELDRIPSVYAERHGLDTYWYFKPEGIPDPVNPYKQEEKKEASKEKEIAYANSDETYVINLCDKVIGLKANRQKRFDFLLGDLHKDGVTQTKLPVDAYYAIHQLVVEYMEAEPIEQVESPIQPDINDEGDVDDDNIEQETDLVVNKKSKGSSRDQKRHSYDQRRAEILPKHDIDLVVISYDNFKYDVQNKIIRNEASDLKIVSKALEEYISAE